MEQKARYKLYTQEYECRRTDSESGIEIVDFVDMDIVPPRFIIEEYHVPDEEGFNPSTADTKGQGFYTHLWTVGVHDEHCCGYTEATPRGELCLGLYREPGDWDVNELQRRLKLREQLESTHRIGEPTSDAERAESARMLKCWQEKASEQRRQMFYDALVASFATHGHRMFAHTPDNLHHGKYHFLKRTH